MTAQIQTMEEQGRQADKEISRQKSAVRVLEEDKSSLQAELGSL